MLRTILDLLPPDAHTLKYVEPFLGSGALFFALKPSKALLGDANDHLLNFYEVLRQRPLELYEKLLWHVERDDLRYYLRIRTQFNTLGWRNKLQQAGRFLYLNRACWNGVFRVNSRDHFNVPYGHKVPLPIPSLERMKEAATSLGNADIRHGDFESILAQPFPRNTLIFADPPYPPRSRTAYFSHYTKGRFDWDDHVRLAVALARCAANGAKIVLTLPDLADVRKLYGSFTKHHAYLFRLVSCKEQRKRVRELIFTNYRVNE